MTRRHAAFLFVLLVALPLAWLPAAGARVTKWRLLAWNDLGMHCTDGTDFSVFAILPPYNNVHAQLVDSSGRLVRSPGAVRVTYEAVADPDRSVNTTSRKKTNFWQFAGALFGVTLDPDVGLAGYRMPGGRNVPQPMAFDAASASFGAEGIPITPFDDTGARNPYPLMRLAARDGSGNLLAQTDVVVPVSDEMDCRACHASGSAPAAQPRSGWVWDADPQRDAKRNVLRLHDDLHRDEATFAAALAAAGYLPAGLAATSESGTPILCARCHASNALPGTGVSGISAFTSAVHRRHAGVLDPTNGLPLDASANRSACYRCHPGSETRCLRGAMGNAVAPDGTLAMQCQACHGSMSRVGDPRRTGWLSQPSCQQCHTGTATRNSGQSRYESVFDASGEPRVAADPAFATNSGVPAAGFSLYRFSRGHGGLSCEACHGSPHAEYPSSHRNDNLQSLAAQGHAGTISECGTCHAETPSGSSGGPHGLHPLGASWVDRHGDVAEHGLDGCRSCHGADLKGTVLSRALGDRTLDAEDFGTKRFWKGFQVGCWACHDGPSSERPARNRPAAVVDATLATAAGRPAALDLPGADPEGNVLAFRVVSQPLHGTVGLVGRRATFFPEAGYAGTDAFTFAAWDGLVDSNLGTVAVNVGR